MTPPYELVRMWFTPKRLARFMRMVKVRPDGCWEWMGARWESGHGMYRFAGGPQRTHRLMFILYHQRDLPEGMRVRHWACDNPACCFYGHLIGATQGDNIHDIQLLSKAYEIGPELEALRGYRKHPYQGYFHDPGDNLGSRTKSVGKVTPPPFF